MNIPLNDTEIFSKHIKDLPPLQDEDLSYDMESLFTNIPINKTIESILDQIYRKERLDAIHSKLIFKRLLRKLATEVTFKINENFYKQTDGCTIGGLLSVTLIYMNKMENYIDVPTKLIFCCRSVDDI